MADKSPPFRASSRPLTGVLGYLTAATLTFLPRVFPLWHNAYAPHKTEGPRSIPAPSRGARDSYPGGKRLRRCWRVVTGS